MAFKVGYFAQPAGAGNFQVTGVGFRPQLVRFYFPDTDVAQTYFGTGIIGHGAMNDAGQQIACASLSIGGTTLTGGSSKRSAKCLTLHDGTNYIFEATYVSMDSDGFTINVSVSDGMPRDICYQAFAGYRLTGIGEYQIPPTASPPIFTFEREFGIAWDTALLGFDGNRGAGDSLLGMGFTGMESFSGTHGDAGNRGITYGSLNWGVAAAGTPYSGLRVSVERVNQNNLTHYMGNLTAGGSKHVATVTSRLTSYDLYVPGVALCGSRSRVVGFTSPTVAGIVPYTGYGFRPEALFFLSQGKAAAPGITTPLRAMHGFSDGTNHYACYQESNRIFVFGVWTTTFVQAASANAIMTWTAGGAMLQADVSSLDDDGFSLNWSSVDPAAGRQIIVLAVAQRTMKFAGPQSYRVGKR